jgi:hypothetical protein
MEEIRVRSNVIKLLVKQGIRGMKEVTEFCRRYSSDAEAAIESLGAKRQDLLR